MILAASMIALTLGTYAFRWSGPALRDRIRFPARTIRLLEVGAVVLIAALVAVTTLPTAPGEFGFALPAGVLIAAALAWRKQPILVVILAAATTTALLRLLGLP
ncbi:AzlD domain-containing protein [Nocardia sp. NPDC051321]|uniref:AzlD domain-containing protein n=1 Tax=Nocardia sp. NPDC051321 TaxID=3364323 RepID=UPI003787FA52